MTFQELLELAKSGNIKIDEDTETIIVSCVKFDPETGENVVNTKITGDAASIAYAIKQILDDQPQVRKHYLAMINEDLKKQFKTFKQSILN